MIASSIIPERAQTRPDSSYPLLGRGSARVPEANSSSAAGAERKAKDANRGLARGEQRVAATGARRFADRREAPALAARWQSRYVACPCCHRVRWLTGPGRTARPGLLPRNSNGVIWCPRGSRRRSPVVACPSAGSLDPSDPFVVEKLLVRGTGVRVKLVGLSEPDERYRILYIHSVFSMST